MRITNKLQISISITNPLNLFYTSTVELKDISSPLFVTFPASELELVFGEETRMLECVVWKKKMISCHNKMPQTQMFESFIESHSFIILIELNSSFISFRLEMY